MQQPAGRPLVRLGREGQDRQCRPHPPRPLEIAVQPDVRADLEALRAARGVVERLWRDVAMARRKRCWRWAVRVRRGRRDDKPHWPEALELLHAFQENPAFEEVGFGPKEGICDVVLVRNRMHPRRRRLM